MQIMKISDFDYILPEALIAQEPSVQRDSSRLMLLDRQAGHWRHCAAFTEIIAQFRPGDLLVLNNTKVVPARLIGRRPSGGKVEILVIAHEQSQATGLVQAARRPKLGEVYQFGEHRASVTGRETNGWRLDFGAKDVGELMAEIGMPPLPPYIKRKGEISAETKTRDRERYQTVYAASPGAIAAPTAGLHFTQSLLDQLAQRGVTIAYVTLHVGITTFLPIRSDDVEQHVMGNEFYHIPLATAEQVNRAKAEGRRVIAVGTTSCRTLETAGKTGTIVPGDGWSQLFIYPGFTFHIVDALITNFHLPQSTLLLLVSALAGKELILRAYAEAVAQKYRFFSYGDAMMIV